MYAVLILGKHPHGLNYGYVPMDAYLEDYSSVKVSFFEYPLLCNMLHTYVFRWLVAMTLRTPDISFELVQATC